jgi:hypothetical protein
MHETELPTSSADTSLSSYGHEKCKYNGIWESPPETPTELAKGMNDTRHSGQLNGQNSRTNALA